MRWRTQALAMKRFFAAAPLDASKRAKGEALPEPKSDPTSFITWNANGFLGARR
jgi:hypothetical protein